MAADTIAPSPALAFVRERLPELLGITDMPTRLAYDALTDLLADARVYEGLTISAARRVVYVVAHAALLDDPTRLPVDAARIVAREAARVLAGHADAERRVVGLALVRATAALLG